MLVDVVDEAGSPRDATVVFIVDGEELACSRKASGAVGSYECGFEIAGDLTIRAVAGDLSAETTVRVRRDECGVRTESFQLIVRPSR